MEDKYTFPVLLPDGKVQERIDRPVIGTMAKNLTVPANFAKFAEILLA